MPVSPTKNEFAKVNALESDKREIKILAAVERRNEYEIVSDMVKLYKTVSIKGGTKHPRRVKTIPVSEIIAAH